MEKPKTLDKVTYALFRTVDRVTSTKRANWIVYGAVAVTTTLLFANLADTPKNPRALGD